MSLQQYPGRRFNLRPYVDLASRTILRAARNYRNQRREQARQEARRSSTTMPRPVPFNVRQYTKRMINRQIETKHTHVGMTDINMNYRTWYYFRPLQLIAPGTAEGQRIGDTISNVYLDLGIYYSQVVGVGKFCNQDIRVLIVATDKEISVPAGAWATTPAQGGLFDTVTASGFHISSAPADKTDYVIVYDRRYTVAQTGANSASQPHRVIRIRKKLCARAVYKEELAGGISFNKVKNYYVLIGGSAIGMLTTDSMGDMQASGFVYFKDG